MNDVKIWQWIVTVMVIGGLVIVGIVIFSRPRSEYVPPVAPMTVDEWCAQNGGMYFQGGLFTDGHCEYKPTLK